MGLLEEQNLLARLYVDGELRFRFLADPKSIVEEFGLSEIEVTELGRIANEEVDEFARSLFSKRLREVQKMLPASSERLGGDFEKHFQLYAEADKESQTMTREEDVIQFCRYLEFVSDTMASEVARFERKRRQFFTGDRNFVSEKFEGRRHLWIRLGRRVFHRVF